MDLRFLGKVLQGALIGLGAVLPGISGGVLSVVFGVYRPIMEFLSDPVHKWRTHLPELFPYMIGSAAGFLGVANLLSYVLETYPEPSVCVFVGLIVGMLPLGLYTPFVEGIGHVRPEVLLPGVAGCVVTFICLAKLVNRLFERQYAVMFHGIFGIVGAATVMTVPWGSFATSADAASRNLFCMAAGIVAALLLEVMNEKMACFPENETE